MPTWRAALARLSPALHLRPSSPLPPQSEKTGLELAFWDPEGWLKQEELHV